MKKHQPPPLEFNSLEETSIKHFRHEKILIPEEFEPHLRKPQFSHLKKFNYFKNISRPTPWKKLSIPMKKPSIPWKKSILNPSRKNFNHPKKSKPFPKTSNPLQK